MGEYSFEKFFFLGKIQFPLGAGFPDKIFNGRDISGRV